MRQPSDKPEGTELQEAEKAFQQALAMPHKTIVELLIQSAELVNAVGVKAVLLMANLEEPQKGVVFEDELEVRAAVNTFREACNEVFRSFDEVLRFLDKHRG